MAHSDFLMSQLFSQDSFAYVSPWIKLEPEDARIARMLEIKLKPHKPFLSVQ